MKLLSHAVPATFLFRLALAQVSDQPTCYFANGTALPNRPGYLQYQACNGSSICCGLNRSNPPNGDRADGFTMDECLPNGLCQNRRTEDGIGKVSYWVDFCTNSNVSAGGCLDICQQTKNAFGNTAIVPCDGTATSDRWCCGWTSDCCTSNSGVVQLAQALGGSLSSVVSSEIATKSSPAATTGSSTSPASADASSTPSSTGATSGSNPPTSASSDSGSKLSGGTIAGVVIGTLAGVALLAAAVVFARRVAMWKKKALAAPETGVAPPYTQHTNGYGSVAVYEVPASDKFGHTYQGEMYGSTPAHELPGGMMGSELPAQTASER